MNNVPSDILTRPEAPTLVELLDVLRMTFKTEGVALWLWAPNRQLDGKSPAQLWDEGEYRRVYGLACALAEGVFS